MLKHLFTPGVSYTKVETKPGPTHSNIVPSSVASPPRPTHSKVNLKEASDCNDSHYGSMSFMCNPKSWEAEAGGLPSTMNSRSTWAAVRFCLTHTKRNNKKTHNK